MDFVASLHPHTRFAIPFPTLSLSHLVLLAQLSIIPSRPVRHKPGLQIAESGNPRGRAFKVVGRQRGAQAVHRFRPAHGGVDVGQRLPHARLGGVQLAHFARHALGQGGGAVDGGSELGGVGAQGGQGLIVCEGEGCVLAMVDRGGGRARTRPRRIETASRLVGQKRVPPRRPGSPRVPPTPPFSLTSPVSSPSLARARSTSARPASSASSRASIARSRTASSPSARATSAALVRRLVSARGSVGGAAAMAFFFLREKGREARCVGPDALEF